MQIKLQIYYIYQIYSIKLKINIPDKIGNMELYGKDLICNIEIQNK